MKIRALKVPERASQGWAPTAQLGLQTTPLVFELADGFGKTHSSTWAAELRAVEAKAATLRLGVNMKEVCVDECDRVRLGLKTAELGMMAITARATEKHLASKERFAP